MKAAIIDAFAGVFFANPNWIRRMDEAIAAVERANVSKMLARATTKRDLDGGTLTKHLGTALQSLLAQHLGPGGTAPRSSLLQQQREARLSENRRRASA